MTKVVYFDELSAMDYLTIIDGGLTDTEVEELEEKNKDLANRNEASFKAKLSFLPFIGGGVESSVNANFEKSSSKLIKTTISNTLLSDFLERSRDNKSIKQLKNFKLSTYPNSIAYFKTFTPYLKMFPENMELEEGLVLNISQMDEAFESGKGYYEMIAKKITKKRAEKKILRFNIASFRNNYGISDLTKMDLTYIATKVGQTSEEMLDIIKEFNFESPQTITSKDQLTDENNFDDKEKLDVLDVILAGINI